MKEKIKLLIIVLGTIAIVGITTYWVVGALSSSGVNENAKKALDMGKYEEAADIYRNNDDMQSLAEVYFKSEEYDKALKIYEQSPKNETTIGRMCDIYAINKDTEKLNELINKYKNTEYKKSVEKYIISPPKFSIKEGKYYTQEPMELSAKGDIYYTTDGTMPDKTSTKYNGKFSLPDGTTHIIAVAYSPLDVKSDISEGLYMFKLKNPDTPGISLMGGTYSGEQVVRINSSDSDAKIYYTTDGSEPNETSKEYKNPLKIMKGHVNLKAVVIDPVGRKSRISENTYYVLNAKENAI